MKFNEQGKIEASSGKVFDEQEFAGEWHPGHPGDELPPMRPRSIAIERAKVK